MLSHTILWRMTEMRTKTDKYFFETLLIFFLLIAILPVKTSASSQDEEVYFSAQSSERNSEHKILARQYENLARKAESKIHELEETINHKPRSSFYGLHGQHVKSRVRSKIISYKKAMEENQEKAEYHRKMAVSQNHQTSDISLKQSVHIKHMPNISDN